MRVSVLEIFESVEETFYEIVSARARVRDVMPYKSKPKCWKLLSNLFALTRFLSILNNL